MNDVTDMLGPPDRIQSTHRRTHIDRHTNTHIHTHTVSNCTESSTL